MDRAKLTVALLTSLLAAATVGCSGGSGSSTTTGAGDNPGWTGQTNVEAIFAANCSECHGDAWSSCWNVQASASIVESEVASGDMPRSGPLSASDKATLVDWLSAGAECTGPREPPTGGGGSGGGEPTPIVAAGWTAGKL
jgi:hypothetical protein